MAGSPRSLDSDPAVAAPVGRVSDRSSDPPSSGPSEDSGSASRRLWLGETTGFAEISR